MVETPRKALKTLAHITVVIGLYLVFRSLWVWDSQVSPLYGNIGIVVTGVRLCLSKSH